MEVNLAYLFIKKKGFCLKLIKSKMKNKNIMNKITRKISCIVDVVIVKVNKSELNLIYIHLSP